MIVTNVQNAMSVEERITALGLFQYSFMIRQKIDSRK